MKIKLTRANVMSSPTILQCKTNPAVIGDGPNDYLCCQCEDVLAEKVASAQISSMCIKCAKCGAVNAFLAVD